MQPKSTIRITAYAVSGIWSAVVALSGLQLSTTAGKALGFIPILLVLLFAVFDNFIWHWPWIVRFVGRPDLRGTWVGTSSGEWIDERDVRHKSHGPAALIVKQTFLTLSVVLVAEKSKSYSYLADIKKLESGEYRVDYEYTNKPYRAERRSMPEHNGSTQLTVGSPRSNHLTGEYWTSRLSNGALDFTWRSSKRVTELAAAQALSQETRKEIT